MSEQDVDTVVFLAIDPGTENVGFTVLIANIDTLNIVSASPWSFKASKSYYFQEHLREYHTDRFLRIQAIKRYVSFLLQNLDPIEVVSEAPFFNPSRPGAFEPLVEVVFAIRETVWEWNADRPLIQIPPSNIKNAVGAKGGANKVTIKEAIEKLDDLPSLDLRGLDEHAIDSLAVGYCRLKQLNTRPFILGDFYA